VRLAHVKPGTADGGSGRAWPESAIAQRCFICLTILLVIVCAVTSTLGAQAVARSDAKTSRQIFVATSTQIASSLGLSIQHEQELVVIAGAFAVRDPEASQATFTEWIDSVGAFARYPELEGVAEIAFVPFGQLTAFAARSVADPAGPLAANGTFQVIPAGTRPFYCLISATQTRAGVLTTPAGTDFCSSSLGPKFLASRISGQGAYLPYKVGSEEELVVGSPVYAGNTAPPTVSQRASSFIGWTGVQLLPRVLLANVLEGHPDSSVAFQYDHGSSNVTFRAGTAPSGAESTTIDLDNGWRVRISGVVNTGSFLVEGNSQLLLLGGLLVSFLLGLLVYVLGTSRFRAMVMVRKRTDQLHHQAFHDSLTGLPNRALILDRLDQMMARYNRHREPIAALFLDLDDFKDVNDTLGHKAGDQLLVKVADRLSRALRGGDTIGRLGGDEFVVLVDGGSLAAGPEVVADRIGDVLATPFQISGSDAQFLVTASIGIAIADGSQAGPEELLQEADMALYRAKAAGKHRVVVFSSAMQDAANFHRSLEVDLRRALQRDEFFLLYQPTVELATGEFTGVEALLRWHHPDRGVVGPDEFIPALESTGLIIPVGLWALRTACRQGALWVRQGHRLTVSVNVSARQFEGGRIVDDLHGALVDSGLEPDMLILELTETTLMHDVEATVDMLNLLKLVGVRIAIDDFGTGYSSLAYLRQFPIDLLKIDQSFVSGIGESPESAAIVHTLVQLGKVLGLETIAEGIETEDQKARLIAEKVDTGQGFLFARPLDVESVDKLLDGGSVIAQPPQPPAPAVRR
jgi:diguanylate cyclase (GGDEF)-like protein